MGLEGFVLLRLGGDQGVEAAQARGDAFLFVGLWEKDDEGCEACPCYLRLG